MEGDVDSGFTSVCTTCLSADRDLISINGIEHVYQIFRLLMYDFAAERFGDALLDTTQLLCWECVAMMKRIIKFKQQVHHAQQHLRVLAMSHSQEALDHTYMSQSLSSLDSVIKTTYDGIYYEYSNTDVEWGHPQQYLQITPQSIKNEQYELAHNISQHILEVPELVIDNQVSNVMSIVVGDVNSFVCTDTFTHSVKPEPEVTNLPQEKLDLIRPKKKKDKEETEKKKGYTTTFMTEEQMLEYREKMKKKVQYASSVYKCELCIIGFYTQQQVEDHFENSHKMKENYTACRVCYVYLSEKNIESHLEKHYVQNVCNLCGYEENSERLMQAHVERHLNARQANQMDLDTIQTKGRKKKKKIESSSAEETPKPGDLRRLLSKTTIEGYKCLECDMFFKSSRGRKYHVDRCHREGLQCDHCKKRFVNRTTLATHLRLHEGPLPRSECPICHKMVRVIQIKYHIQRHQNKSRYDCKECNKTFSHLATYQAHLKYSRAHASEQVFKFPCPMCNKGYPTKEAMQDHFNYQHLGKTVHKCPICDKPIASRLNVDKHMMRVHGEKKEKPRNHQCRQCLKAFTDKKALTQHEAIHSGERPLSCDICQQTFKQKASLYTHRKRVHKVFPSKKVVEFMDSKS